MKIGSGVNAARRGGVKVSSWTLGLGLLNNTKPTEDTKITKQTRKVFQPVFAHLGSLGEFGGLGAGLFGAPR
jgi:hypothetical protein